MPTLKEPKKIDIREAAAASGVYLKSLFPELGAYNLEEVELSEDSKYWLITLSYDSTETNVFGGVIKSYKVFKVDVKTGEVVAMKIRTLE